MGKDSLLSIILIGVIVYSFLAYALLKDFVIIANINSFSNMFLFLIGMFSIFFVAYYIIKFFEQIK